MRSLSLTFQNKSSNIIIIIIYIRNVVQTTPFSLTFQNETSKSEKRVSFNGLQNFTDVAPREP